MLDVRPGVAGDRENVRRFLHSVDQADLRYRFLGTMKSSRFLDELFADPGRSSREDLIAVDRASDTIAAIATIARGTGDQCAEVAVLVRSDLKGAGIGWEMLREACAYAKDRGYRRVACLEAVGNSRAMRLEHEQGFTARAHDRNPERVILTKDLT